MWQCNALQRASVLGMYFLAASVFASPAIPSEESVKDLSAVELRLKAAAGSNTPPAELKRRWHDETLLAAYGRKMGWLNANKSMRQVGFSDDALVEQGVAQILQFGAQVRRAVAQCRIVPIDQAASGGTMRSLAALSSGKPSLGIALNDKQQQYAKTQPLISVVTDHDKRNVTLWDIWQRENIQGKYRLRQGDNEYLQQASVRVAEQTCIHVVAEQAYPELTQEIKHMLQDSLDAEKVRRHMGVSHVLHAENPVLKARAGSLPLSAVRDYYQLHTTDFTQPFKAKARFWQFHNQTNADNARTALVHGEPADAVARQYGGTLKVEWLEHKPGMAGWRTSAMLLQSVGEISKPMRQPNGGKAQFEIFQVLEKREKTLPLSDTSVQYEVRRALAAQQLQTEYESLLDQLRRSGSLVNSKSESNL
ncbi:Uncharacterised protein [BD1-7 clade bacterium]|uniref:Peptidylprolyl isomerase n=1 Tax=BD1-7 clade bacterium TaxID=2029982 RepID=A0A5S9Q494_9GAMM|nr:Uncharacterised protein [BD1-7 clade bacterium]